tara:strand:+ start:118 stop:960 length:843 start_codon:yes stop_codon:yes gene_type:complete
MMNRKGLQLPCEKCGEVIKYDGVSLPSQTCPHCGAKRPHTLKGNPLLPFLFFFGGWIVFAIVNPLGWDEDFMIFPAFGSLLLLVWFKAFLPIHLGMRRNKSILPMGEDATKGRRALGCVSISFLLGGLLSLLIFFATCERPEPIYYDNTPYFELQGYPIPVDSNDTATPLFDARGRVVPTVKAGTDTFPVSSVSGEQTEISFTNRMEFHVRVYGIDANGSALHLNYLEQNQGSLPMKTYAGQTWLVTNYVGRPIFYFIAEKGMEGEVGSARILPDNWEDR